MGRATDPLALPPPKNPTDPAMGEVIGEVEKQFGTMVVNARNNIRARAAAIHPDLQPTGFKVLTILSHSGPVQQVALAHEVGTDKAVMSRTIKQLVALGLVTRTADPGDGRALLVAMTPEARTRFDKTMLQARRLLYDRLSTWDVGEVRRFADLLARLNESTD